MTSVSRHPHPRGDSGGRVLGQWLWLLPRNLALAFVLTWQKIISPLYGDVCRYAPTCSTYGRIALQQHGLLRGSWLTVKRIASCHPWAKGGIDDVPAPKHWIYDVTRAGFVVPRRNQKG